MDIGVALPQMATGLDRSRVQAWCRGIDEGPFSSVSAGERITFHNLDGMTLCSAAAALTERVRVFLNVAVAPWHAPAELAKQLATLDVLSDGRAEVALGVGGRQQDYDALGSSFANRHSRVDAAAAELRRLWDGGPAADGTPIGPACVQPSGPPIYCSG
ncbi:MAG TPA: LLM class flavin-dependent oxidoreductase, partial [Ilumatobacteraceae bacterium]